MNPTQDAVWRPSGRFAWLRQRAELLADIRTFFSQRGVIEVNTPLISRYGVTEPQIQSIALAEGQGFLRTSPEYHHKRLLAAGFGDLYELGPVMRAGERGRHHQPEFTLLEWYRVGWGWQQLADETVALIRHCSRRSARTWDMRLVSWRELFMETAQLDPLEIHDADLRARTAALPEDCDRSMRLDYLLSTEIQPQLPSDQLTVLHHFPAEQAALAELDPDDPRLARRFEVFLGSLELGNGYQELCDADEQARRFAADNRRRADLGLPSMPVDNTLLAALRHGLPACSGIALGVDRLLMALSGANALSELVAFAD